MNEIWTEKYRPRLLKDMRGQENVVSRLSAFITEGSLPHLLLAGPAGSGKTTASLCIARELYGGRWHSNFLELNASNERGIDTIRVKVKDFAKTMPMGTRFKVIYLDEADALTQDAQHALRRTMEKYSETTRFILACNYMSKIIPPIQSRCAVFRFSPLSRDETKAFLKDIAIKENVDAEDSAYDAILDIAEGDMRRAVNVLQTASILKKKVTEKTVNEVAGGADPAAVKMMLQNAVSGDYKKAREALLDLILKQGFQAEDIMKEVYRQIHSLDIPDERKLILMEKAGEYEFRLTEGSNPRIQLEAMLASFAISRKL
ncbi:MAG: replication factor C small subunit [Candidatus Aenigmarchaeota archaeon]|nr:replication factor C small subunit [Candidatus Aenigmarchaeota archaeon]